MFDLFQLAETKKRTDLELDPALKIVTLIHGDVVLLEPVRLPPLDLAHPVRVFERAPLQGNILSSDGEGDEGDGGDSDDGNGCTVCSSFFVISFIVSVCLI